MKYRDKFYVFQRLFLKLKIAFILTCLCAGVLFSRCTGEKWYSVNVDAYSMENSLIRITYGSPPEGYWGNGIIEFLYKPTNENFGYTLDTYGCGYAMYDRTGPASYELLNENSDMVEVRITFTDSVDVVKRERIYRNLPILEIEYEKLSIWWWEDFFDNPDDSVVVSVYGIPQDITKGLHTEYKKTAEEKCGHNFGDCFINAADSDSAKCTYKEHFIFGVHSTRTGRGIGEVLPVKIGLHDGWKLWWSDRNIPNYESFPVKELPIKRWIFIYKGGRQGLMKMGKAIVDEKDSISDIDLNSPVF
ncbi:hypothetical protein ACFL40_02510 [candidate division KSB1 bacterium]